MTSTQAARMVAAAGVIMAAYVLTRGGGEEKVFRGLWAVGAVTLGLAFLADFVPELAGPFTILIVVALAVREHARFGRLFGVSGGGGAPAAAPSSKPAGGGKPA